MQFCQRNWVCSCQRFWLGALTRAIGGAFSGAAAAVRLVAPTAVGAAGEIITAPIGWGLGMVE